MRKILVAAGILFLMTTPILAESGFNLNKVDIHGFVSQGYIKSSDYDFYTVRAEDGSFDFNEFGLNVTSPVTDDLRLGMQLLARDLGELGNDKVEIDWAYADYSFRNWLGLRVGRVKKPDGIFNQYRDIDATRTCIFLPMGLYREDARDASLATNGAGIYGALPGGVEYQATYGVMDINEDGGVAKRFENTMGAKMTDSKVDPAYNLWLNWSTPLPGLSIGTSATDFDFDLDADIISSLPMSTFTGDPAHSMTFLDTRTPMALRVYGGENRIFSQYRYNELMLAAEYLWGDHNIDTKVSGMTIEQKMDVESWYVMATYRFCKWFELGTYYCEDVEDTNDRDGDNHVAAGDPKEMAWLNDWAITTRFDINPYWIFKMEAHMMDGLYNVDYGDDIDPSANWQMYTAKLTYIF
jgi:hypothetical protein